MMRRDLTNLNRTCFLVFAPVLVGCHHTSTLAPPAPHHALAPCVSAPKIRDELYFTLNPGGQDTISSAAWKDFFEHEIARRFVSGVTVTQAYGRNIRDAGFLVREPTRVVILVHPECDDAESGIGKIIAGFESRFGGGSVLRITVP